MTNNSDNPIENCKLSIEEIADTLDKLNHMKVAELKDICRSMELRLGGRKADLIDSIESYFKHGLQFNDNIRMLTIRVLVLKRVNGTNLPNYKELHTAIRNGSYSLDGVIDTSKAPMGLHPQRSNLHAYDSIPHKGHSLYFLDNPFFRLRRLVHGSPQLCSPAKGRGECIFQFIFDSEEYKLVENNPEMKLYLLCGKQGSHGISSTEVPIEYPSPSEIHINNTQYMGQYKGIKGKIGTAKPADLTEFIKAPPSQNKVTLVYSQTQDSFLAYLYIVQAISPELVLETVKQRPKIHKTATIARIKSTNDDEDIEISGSTMPLTDPVSRTKMKFPIQSIYCTHTQCFDGMIFLQTQLQMPTWSCPICSRRVEVKDLAISEYFEEIVNQVGEDVDTVIINVDGSWEVEVQAKKEDETNANGRSVSAQAEEIISLSSDEESEDEQDAPAPKTAEIEQEPDIPVNALTEQTAAMTTTYNTHTAPNGIVQQLSPDWEHTTSLDKAIGRMEDNINQELNDESPLASLRDVRDRFRKGHSTPPTGNNSINISPVVPHSQLPENLESHPVPAQIENESNQTSTTTVHDNINQDQASQPQTTGLCPNRAKQIRYPSIFINPRSHHHQKPQPRGSSRSISPTNNQLRPTGLENSNDARTASASRLSSTTSPVENVSPAGNSTNDVTTSQILQQVLSNQRSSVPNISTVIPPATSLQHQQVRSGHGSPIIRQSVPNINPISPAIVDGASPTTGAFQVPRSGQGSPNISMFLSPTSGISPSITAAQIPQVISNQRSPATSPNSPVSTVEQQNVNSHRAASLSTGTFSPTDKLNALLKVRSDQIEKFKTSYAIFKQKHKDKIEQFKKQTRQQSESQNEEANRIRQEAMNATSKEIRDKLISKSDRIRDMILNYAQDRARQRIAMENEMRAQLTQFKTSFDKFMKKFDADFLEPQKLLVHQLKASNSTQNSAFNLIPNSEFGNENITSNGNSNDVNNSSFESNQTTHNQPQIDQSHSLPILQSNQKDIASKRLTLKFKPFQPKSSSSSPSSTPTTISTRRVFQLTQPVQNCQESSTSFQSQAVSQPFNNGQRTTETSPTTDIPLHRFVAQEEVNNTVSRQPSEPQATSQPTEQVQLLINSPKQIVTNISETISNAVNKTGEPEQQLQANSPMNTPEMEAVQGQTSTIPQATQEPRPVSKSSVSPISKDFVTPIQGTPEDIQSSPDRKRSLPQEKLPSPSLFVPTKLPTSPEKRQKIIGTLGIELSKDAIGLEPSPSPEETTSKVHPKLPNFEIIDLTGDDSD